MMRLKVKVMIKSILEKRIFYIDLIHPDDYERVLVNQREAIQI
jgi:hypothetical protein